MYSTSDNNQKCLGPCYPPGKRTMHPLTLDFITIRNYPYCATTEWQMKDRNIWVDSCRTQPLYTKDEMLKSYLYPSLGITSKELLHKYYGISNFEQALDWITNNKSEYFYTKMRIINCAWKSYGMNVDLMNDQLLDFYTDLILNKWSNDLIELKLTDKVKIKQYMYRILSEYVKTFSDDWSKIDDHNKNIKEFILGKSLIFSS